MTLAVRWRETFFVNQLNISEECVNNMAFVRCHRLGKRQHYGKRPVIVRFQSYADRQMVWSKRIHLKNKAFSLHENYANEVEYRRRLMYPILAEAKKSGKYNKTYLNGDVLRIDGSDYTVDDLNRLPDDLRGCILHDSAERRMMTVLFLVEYIALLISFQTFTAAL